MSFNYIQGEFDAVQDGPSGWTKARQVTAKNAKLYSLDLMNKGADCFIQVFDVKQSSDIVEAGNPNPTKYRVYPCPGNDVLTIKHKKFGNGIYWRAVIKPDGINTDAIATDDINGEAYTDVIFA